MTAFTMYTDCEFRFPNHPDPSLDFQDLTANLSIINTTIYEITWNFGKKSRVRNMFKK